MQDTELERRGYCDTLNADGVICSLKATISHLEKKSDEIAESRSFWTKKAHELEMECQRLTEENESLHK